MGFDEGKSGALAPTADFEANLKTYTDQVAAIGTQIKAKQAELDTVQDQVADAKVQVQLAYQTKIQALEDQIVSLKAQIVSLQAQSDQLTADIGVKQAVHDAIDTNLTNEKQRIETSWADFHTQAAELLAQQNELKAGQDKLASDTAALASLETAFTVSKVAQQTQIDQMQAAAQEALDKGNATLIIAQEMQEKADAAADAVTAAQADLASKLVAAQPILAQVDAIAAQKAQNDADQKTNSANALQNQNDANEIKVAKVVLNNQQVDYNNRMQALQQAEAALAKGQTS